ncbi:hypothetical protein [Streptomyces globisporus]|uniref:hypothetical protein n=1 Tax=Streptomyces globisporus TaxID=1908 RepID=UPI00345FAFC0|nr:hypothetical protein OG838_02900 [Streptomyces globisporus]
MQLPEQPVAGQPDPTIHDNAARFLAAINDIEKATYHRDETPLPIVGSAPPVEQPGRPAMSQKATDTSVLMLAAGATTVMVTGSAAGLMYFSQFADPVACAIVLGAPVALVMAVSRLVARARTAAPQPVTNHFHGNVHHDTRTVTSTTRGVIANTRNQLPK